MEYLIIFNLKRMNLCSFNGVLLPDNGDLMDFLAIIMEF